MVVVVAAAVDDEVAEGDWKAEVAGAGLLVETTVVAVGGKDL